MPLAIDYGPEVLADLDEASRREWLETNGLGGFASSTITGCATRRYHGLLVAATRPPAGRELLLAKLEETLVSGAERYELGVNRYPGVVHPRGHRLQTRFRLDPFPVFTWDAGGVRLEKRVFMVDGENTVVVDYEVVSRPASSSPRVLALELRPLVAFRDYHSLTRANPHLNPHFRSEEGLITLEPYAGGTVLHLAHDADELEDGGWWYYNVEYDLERQRGLDFQEDLFNPLVLRFDLAERSRAVVIASTRRRRASEARHLGERELARRAAIIEACPSSDPLAETLALAADRFLVRRGAGQSVIAGYPWFTDWGRDTMISLPGLAAATGRFDAARSVLEEFSRWVDQGMLPNRFPDIGEAPEYNTADATLWFFVAADAYGKGSGDEEFVRERLVPVLREIVDWHERGTRYGIRMDDDGLLACGEPGVQLTWMDAKIGDWVVTPRYGKPVEIQALWYNALRTLESLTGEQRYGGWAERARAAFDEQFWNEREGCLYDVVAGDERDGSIRPNQLFALSLPYPLVEGERAASVLAVVERDLVTPFGLRTLSPRDPRYRGRYEGPPAERDSIYHQGTVWPWLLGAYADACRRVRGAAPDIFAPWRDYLRGRGAGLVPEIFDGETPHQARGCFAQAWSVAELARVLLTTEPARAE